MYCIVLNLKNEFVECTFQAQHRIQLQQEQRRANDAELQMKHVSHQSEERISSLESKLSELSDVVGDYERLRFQVRIVILYDLIYTFKVTICCQQSDSGPIVLHNAHC